MGSAHVKASRHDNRFSGDKTRGVAAQERDHTRNLRWLPIATQWGPSDYVLTIASDVEGIHRCVDRPGRDGIDANARSRVPGQPSGKGEHTAFGCPIM